MCDSGSGSKVSSFDLAFLLKMFSESVHKYSEINENEEGDCKFLSEYLVKLLLRLVDELKKIDSDDTIFEAFHQVTLIFSNITSYFEKYVNSRNNMLALIQYLNENLKRIGSLISQIFENKIDDDKNEIDFEEFEDAFGNLIEINGRLVVLHVTQYAIDSTNVVFRNFDKFHFNLFVRFMNGVDMQFNENLKDFSNFLYEYEEKDLQSNPIPQGTILKL